MSEIIGNRERSYENKLQDAIKYVLKEKRTIGEAVIVYDLPYFMLHFEIQIKKFANENVERENMLRSAIQDIVNKKNIFYEEEIIEQLGDDYTPILTQLLGYKYEDDSTKDVIQHRELPYLTKILKTLGESGCICKNNCAKDLMSYLAVYLLQEKGRFKHSLSTIRQPIETRLCGDVMRNELSTSKNFGDHCVESDQHGIFYTCKEVEAIFHHAFLEKDCRCLKCLMQKLPEAIYFVGGEKSRNQDQWDHVRKLAGPVYTEHFRKRYDIIFFHVVTTKNLKSDLQSVCRNEDNRQIIDAQESLSTIKRKSSNTEELSDTHVASTAKAAKFDSTSQESMSEPTFITTDLVDRLTKGIRKLINTYLPCQPTSKQECPINAADQLSSSIHRLIYSFLPTSEKKSTNVDETTEEKTSTDEEEIVVD